ncbi:MAG: CDP-glycerol glycerophosphotransferase family protein [Propionibacteriaceae bacterium]|jgi:CDP-glycerol glycerophosphotransferase|nr:CDP-glycerol glycerophosphotransferase family protein [Propionibacteriaceae bacterium]
MGNAAFDFQTANRSKLAAIPKLFRGQVRSRFSKRDSQTWVIGSHFGLGDGAWAFYQAAKAADPSLRIIWLVSEKWQAAQAEQKGVEWLTRDSQEGYEATIHAGLIAITHGFGDVNRYAEGGAKIVQLWHGTPIKKLHLDSPQVLDIGKLGDIPGTKLAIKSMYRVGLRSIDLFPVSSDAVVPFISSAFGLTKQVQPLGEPRTDVMFGGSKRDRTDQARALWAKSIPELGDRRIILYAPTWRDGGPDPAIPTPDEWKTMQAWLGENDAVLVLRPHPYSISDYPKSEGSIKVLSRGEQPYLMPLLWGVDTLITDYSSTISDYSITGRPIVMFAPDLAKYEAKRGLYLDYEWLSGGRRHRNWAQVFNTLSGIFSGSEVLDIYTEHSDVLRGFFQKHLDGRNSYRTVRAALDLIN